MNLKFTTLLFFASIFTFSNVAHAEKLKRDDIETYLPQLNKIVKKQFENEVSFKIKSIELGEGSSLVYNIVFPIELENKEIYTKYETAIVMVCNDIKVNNMQQMLEQLDYIQYSYYDKNEILLNSIKINKNTCNDIVDNNNINENGKYNRKFIQENLVNPTNAQKEQLNKYLKNSFLEIDDVYLSGQGSSYTIKYNAIDKLAIILDKSNDTQLESMKNHMIKSSCTQKALLEQLKFLDSIDYEMYTQKHGDKPIITYSISSDSCK